MNQDRERLGTGAVGNKRWVIGKHMLNLFGKEGGPAPNLKKKRQTEEELRFGKNHWKETVGGLETCHSMKGMK